MVKPTPALEQLEGRRRELEARFGDLRLALDRELGWAPKAKTWVLPAVGFASGLAIAAWLVARRRD
ncbi:MAG: hypothetical protein AAF657_34795 [Acidobacteriota bacterium]